MAADWGLELGDPFELARYSYVAPADDEAVLKLTPPGDDESEQEADALERWDGDGAVRLLRRDRERRALLLERARPGADISGLPEHEATAIAVALAPRLWRPAAEPFRWIGDHVPRWLRNAESSGRAGAALIPLALDQYHSFDAGRSVLVHGDFHHHNVLDAGGRHVAIDPKPMLGEAEYDVPSFLWNPIGCRLTPELAESRLAAFAAIGLDQRRMRAWSVIRGAYLSDDAEEVEVLRLLL